MTGRDLKSGLGFRCLGRRELLRTNRRSRGHTDEDHKDRNGDQRTWNRHGTSSLFRNHTPASPSQCIERYHYVAVCTSTSMPSRLPSERRRPSAPRESLPLLSDADHAVAIAYGACPNADARYPDRVSFLIDEHGTIERVYDQVDPRDHPARVLANVSPHRPTWRAEPLETKTGWRSEGD